MMHYVRKRCVLWTLPFSSFHFPPFSSLLLYFITQKQPNAVETLIISYLLNFSIHSTWTHLQSLSVGAPHSFIHCLLLLLLSFCCYSSKTFIFCCCYSSPSTIQSPSFRSFSIPINQSFLGFARKERKKGAFHFSIILCITFFIHKTIMGIL